jgi:hypothetical protein
MTEEKSGPSSDLQALAQEACDLWHEHLSSYANDPKAKAELMRLMAPSRQLFAEWATLMQNGAYGAANLSKTTTAGEKSGGEAQATGFCKHQTTSGAEASRTEAVGRASDGNADQFAELADRVAKLEERLARLDPGSAGKTSSPQSASGRNKS